MRNYRTKPEHSPFARKTAFEGSYREAYPILVQAAALEDMKPRAGKVFDDTNLRTEWAKACTACGLGKMIEQTSNEGNVWQQYSGLIMHDLRRSAIRNMIAAGNPEKGAMSISGHKTASVFRRYNIVSTTDITTAMRALRSTR
jgi:hypothetical protein